MHVCFVYMFLSSSLVRLYVFSVLLAPSQPHAYNAQVESGPASTHFLCNRLAAGGRCRFSIVRSRPLSPLSWECASENRASRWLSISAAIVYCVAERRLASYLYLRIDA